MKRKRIVIDITSLMEVTFVSGIQRVVREIIVRMVSKRGIDGTRIQLIAYSLKRLGFFAIPEQRFLDCYQSGLIHVSALSDDVLFSFDQLGPWDIFFDIDSVWNNRMRRSFLLPILKRQGVSIAVQIYDIIPILYPQFCDAETTLRFMDYLGAHLLFADLIIANTESTLCDIRKLTERIGTKPIQTTCVPLGADLPLMISEPTKSTKTDPSLLRLGKGRFLLMVGTIEPRKNHAFMLDLYEQKLRSEGFLLVIAGRQGWNVEELMERIRSLQKADEHFLYFSHANDETINYLYKNAFFTVFPTQYEGFGLPIIESFLHHTPILASDIPVLREVGGDLCDYFTLNSQEDFQRMLLYYSQNPSRYARKKNMLESYVPCSWDQSEEMMWEALQQLRTNDR